MVAETLVGTCLKMLLMRNRPDATKLGERVQFDLLQRLVTPIPDGRLQANSGSSERSSDSSKRVEKLLMENILAINKNGVFFLDLESRETIDHYPFSEIISTRRIKSSENGALYLDMKCGNLMSQRITRMQTDQVTRQSWWYELLQTSLIFSSWKWKPTTPYPRLLFRKKEIPVTNFPSKRGLHKNLPSKRLTQSRDQS